MFEPYENILTNSKVLNDATDDKYKIIRIEIATEMLVILEKELEKLRDMNKLGLYTPIEIFNKTNQLVNRYHNAIQRESNEKQEIIKNMKDAFVNTI